MTDFRLFTIPLQGDGTPDVESLPSYLHRLAWEHEIYVGELLRFLYVVAQHEQEIQLLVDLPSYVTPNELVRPNRATIMIADLLARYSRQDLSSAILWVLQGDLGRSSGEVVHGFRWCPECLAEMVSLGRQPYFKLIWHLTAIRACPTHRTPMLNTCEACSASQAGFIKRYAIDRCQLCGKRLTRYRQLPFRFDDITTPWSDISHDVVRLFADIAATRCQAFPNGGIRQSVKDLFDYYSVRGREQELYDSLSREEILAVLNEDKPVALVTARRLAYRLGLSLFDLLSGNAAYTSDVLDVGMFCRLPPGYLEANHRTKLDHRDVLARIRYLLQSSEYPPSLKEVARRVEVSVGYIQYRYPVIAKEVVRQHATYVDETKRKRAQYAQRVVLEYFVKEKNGPCPPSRKQAYRVLRAQTGLPKFLLKRSIQSAYLALQ